MDFFKLSKYQSKIDNPIYMSKIIFVFLKSPMTIDQLFEELCESLKITWSSSVEQSMLLALCFTFSIGIVIYKNGLLQRKDCK